MNTLTQTCGGLQPLTSTTALLIAVHDDLALKLDVRSSSGRDGSQKIYKAAALPRNTLHMTSAVLEQRAVANNSEWSLRSNEISVANVGQYEFTTKRRAPVCPKPSMRWSRESYRLRQALAELQPLQPSPLRTVPGLLSFFTHLDLSSTGVRQLDETIVRECKALLELSLSNNQLTEIHDLPSSLESFNAYHNRITAVDLTQVRQGLLHLGLGYNRLTSLGHGDAGLSGSGVPRPLAMPAAFPNLVSLDVCQNDFTDLAHVLQQLACMKKLRHLVLAGNPVCLVKDYMMHVLCALPDLDSLDEINFNPAAKAEMQQRVKECGRPLGLQAGARTDMIELQLVLDAVCSLPSPASILQYLKLSPTAVPSLGLGGTSTRPATADTKTGKGAPAKGSTPAVAAVPSPPAAPACRYLLEVDLAGVWSGESKEVMGMYATPVVLPADPTATKPAARPASASKGGAPPPAQAAAKVSTGLASKSAGTAPRPDVTTAVATTVGRDFPASSAIVWDDSRMSVQLRSTVDARDALLHGSLHARLVEVSAPPVHGQAAAGGAELCGQGPQEGQQQGSAQGAQGERRVLGHADIPLRALLRGSEKSTVTTGALSGELMPVLAVTALPSPASAALGEIRAAVRAAQLALEQQAADAAALASAPSIQPAGKSAPAAAKKGGSGTLPEALAPVVEPSLATLLANEGGRCWDDQRLEQVIKGICQQSRAKLGATLSLIRWG